MELKEDNGIIQDSKKTFIVVDSNNNWLEYGEAESPKQALEFAKECYDFDLEARTHVFEVRKAWELKQD